MCGSADFSHKFNGIGFKRNTAVKYIQEIMLVYHTDYQKNIFGCLI